MSVSFLRHCTPRRIRRRILIPAILFAVFAAVFLIRSGRTQTEIPASAETESLTENELTERQRFADFTEEFFRAELSSDAPGLHYLLSDPEEYGIDIESPNLGFPASLSAEEASAGYTELLAELASYDTEYLTDSQRLTLDVLTAKFSASLALAQYPLYAEILSPSTGLQAELPVLLAEYAFRRPADIEDYLTLLADVPRYLGAAGEFEEEKAKAGLFMSDELADRIISDCETFAESGGEYLRETFEEKLVELGLSDTTAESFRIRHETLLADSVCPAYRALAEILRNLLGSGTNSGGLCNYPDGNTYYEALAADATGSEKSISELRTRIGSQLVSDMQKISDLLESRPELSGEIASFSFAQTEPETILAGLREAITEDFPSLPDDIPAPEVRQVAASMEEASSPAFYLTCPLDDLTENVIYINPASSQTSSAGRLAATLAHEGYPGHLYQTVYTDSRSTDPVRSLLSFPGYTEGWATYAEQYAYTLVSSSDPELAELVRLNSSVSLGLSALLDILIHADGYTLEDTADFLSQYITITEESVQEIYLTITGNPANYLKYYVGYLEFLDLREYAQELAGEDYSLKQFHQAVLTIGEAPFSVIRKYLPDYM